MASEQAIRWLERDLAVVKMEQKLVEAKSKGDEMSESKMRKLKHDLRDARAEARRSNQEEGRVPESPDDSTVYPEPIEATARSQGKDQNGGGS